MSPTLASVVLIGAEQWTRLDENDIFSRLRTTFWGVDIATARQDWWNNHQDEVTVGRNEIDEDCFVLDFMPDFMPSRLWVRKDYVRIYDHCHKHCEDTREDWGHHPLVPSVIITGQPGIGKSYWIYYAIRRRLGEGQPFLWCQENHILLFVEDGVFELPRKMFSSRYISPFIWTFINARYFPNDVVLPIDLWQSKLFNIYVSLPRQKRWKHLEEDTLSSLVIMNSWTKDELVQAARTRHVVARTERVEEIFNQCGGIPRICANILYRPNLLDEYRTRFECAIQCMTVQMLLDYTFQAVFLEFDEVPDTIFLVERSDLDNLRSLTVVPASPLVRMGLKSQIRKVRQTDQIRLYEDFARKKPSRQMAGVIFESFAQSVLERGTMLKLVPMRQQFSGPRGRVPSVTTSSSHTTEPSYAIPEWENGQSAVLDQDSASPEEAHSSLTLGFQPRRTVEYEGNMIGEIDEGVFYVPEASNQVAFDSFILFDGFLHIFQFSIASKHGIKPGFASFFSGQGLASLPPKSKWRYIFVVPTGNSISFPQPSDGDLMELLKGVTLFSVQLNIHEDFNWDGEDDRAAMDRKRKRMTTDDDEKV
ncbi:hypothetical protein BC826DRAFT_970525 [Russula brevipes]|nr:hypothetical protein BC826DRAFT_970525 [Russula brevipes]